MTSAAVQECLASIRQLHFPEADEIEVMCKQCERIIDLLFFLYRSQNEAIGRYAREKGRANLSLSEMEQSWIDDPDGEDRFYSEFEKSNKDEYLEIKKHCDLFILMLFQSLLKCDPTHLYLLRKRLDHEIEPDDLSSYSSTPKDPEEEALRRLRERLKPFEEIVH